MLKNEFASFEEVIAEASALRGAWREDSLRNRARAEICNAFECRQRARNLVDAALTTDAEKRVLRFVLHEEGE